jgi:triosephosphate isomerase
MIRDAGCAYVVVGHSERRRYFGETDATVNKKIKAALRAGLTPILCFGEVLEERKAGTTTSKVDVQLEEALRDLPAEEAGSVVFAYEPVWAIGTGEVATPADAQQVCGAIRSRIAETYGDDAAASVRVLYGGSVKAGNVAGIMAQPDVDGALVGGASLDPDEFVGIVRFRMHPPELVG